MHPSEGEDGFNAFLHVVPAVAVILPCQFAHADIGRTGQYSGQIGGVGGIAVAVVDFATGGTIAFYTACTHTLGGIKCHLAVVEHGGHHNSLEGGAGFVAVAAGNVAPQVFLYPARSVTRKAAACQHIARFHFHQYRAAGLPAILIHGVSQGALCYVLISGVDGGNNVFAVLPLLNKRGVLIGDVAILHGQPRATGKAAADIFAISAAQNAVVIALKAGIALFFDSLVVQANGVFAKVAVDMGPYIAHHTALCRLAYHIAAPAGQTADGLPLRIGYPAGHIETTGALGFVVFVDNAVVEVLV